MSRDRTVGLSITKSILYQLISRIHEKRDKDELCKSSKLKASFFSKFTKSNYFPHRNIIKIFFLRQNINIMSLSIPQKAGHFATSLVSKKAGCYSRKKYTFPLFYAIYKVFNSINSWKSKSNVVTNCSTLCHRDRGYLELN